MANYQALTVQSGVLTQLGSNTLVAGSGITSNSGNLTIGAAGSNVVVNTALQFAAGVGITVASGSSAFDFSGGSGVFKTSTGAGTLTFGAGSTLSTTSGALTITSAAAATWSTGAGGLTLSGAGGITLQGGGTSAAIVNSAGTAITIQAGCTLTTTSTGMINLPSQFQIGGSGVSANVSATNLGTLTAGSSSNADALHTHSNVAASAVNVTGMTTSALSSGMCGYYGSASTLSLTDSGTYAKAIFGGLYTGTSGSVQVAGLATANFTTAGGAPTAGSPVWLAAAADDTNTGAGKLTATAPTSGVVAQVGVCVSAAGYAGAKTCVVLLQPGDPIQL